MSGKLVLLVIFLWLLILAGGALFVRHAIREGVRERKVFLDTQSEDWC